MPPGVGLADYRTVPVDQVFDLSAACAGIYQVLGEAEKDRFEKELSHGNPGAGPIAVLVLVRASVE